MSRPVFTALLMLVTWATSAPAQPPSPAPTPTFLGAILTYPAWFHLRHVTVSGTLRLVDDVWWLEADNGDRVRLVPPDRPAGASRVELHARVYDVGRLRQTDPQMADAAMQRVLVRAALDRWPRPGELVILRSVNATVLKPAILPTPRAITLENDRYLGKLVTIVGQFRGPTPGNDLPAAPGRHRYEFVLAADGASIWVSGLRPRVNNVDLSVRNGADLDRWFAVEGTVRRHRGLVWLEGRRMASAPVPRRMLPTVTLRADQLQPAEVMFSVPVEGDTEVPTDTTVRIQFTRPVAPATFEGRVRAWYDGEPAAAAPAFVTGYATADRVLTIRFRAPLARFRRVSVAIEPGVTTLDGSPVSPWRLTFTTGT